MATKQKQRDKGPSVVNPTKYPEEDLHRQAEDELETEPVASMTYSYPKELQTFVESVAKIAGEAVLNVDRDRGIWARTVDPADVCMVILDMPKTCFDQFKVFEEGRTGVDFDNLLKAAKRHKNQTPTLNIGTKGEAEVHLEYVAKDREYSQPTFSPDAVRKPPTVPMLDLGRGFELPVAELYRAIRDATEVSDHAALSLRGDRFGLEAEDETRYTKTWELDEPFGHEESKFSIDYLVDVFHPRTKRFDMVTTYLGTDRPVIFEVESDTGAALRYLLAPRIEA